MESDSRKAVAWRVVNKASKSVIGAEVFEPGGAVTLPRPCPKVTHIRPLDRGGGALPWRTCKLECCAVARTSPEQNKALVLEAFDALFNRRDYAAAERYWSDRYIQHSAHIEPGP